MKAAMQFSAAGFGPGIKPIPVVIADPEFFKQEKTLPFIKNRFGLLRNPYAPQEHSSTMLIERINGDECPVKVVISTDEFNPLDPKTLNPIHGFDEFKAALAATYLEGYLGGYASALD